MAPRGGVCLGLVCLSLVCLGIVCLTQPCLAQDTPQVSLDTSETLFTVLTSINACGFHEDLDASLPIRAQVQAQVAQAEKATQDGIEVTKTMCGLYDRHESSAPSRTLADYVSLALYLNPPPALTLKVKESDLPPDASAVLGILPAMQKFAELAGLHKIWQQHQSEYDALTGLYHAPVAKMLFDTEIYLKQPSATYLGRQFTVFLDPMGAPGQTNARNYGADYYVVISPGRSTGLKMEQIRHTYLHYLLDPMALKYPDEMMRLQPLLQTVKPAPMDQSFKEDASLLVTECLIRAVEAHLTGSGRGVEARRQLAVEDAEKQGYILTSYFYGALTRFEKDPESMREAYEGMLEKIDVHKEQKEAEHIHFAAKADPEVMHVERPTGARLLMRATQHLSEGDSEGAQKLAQQALDEHSGDAGEAFFIMAEAATMNRDMPGASKYFQEALEVAHEPRVVAWAHVYLGRIFDLQENREAALDHYRAAEQAAGIMVPAAKAAAEEGIEKPYAPPTQPEKEQQ